MESIVAAAFGVLERTAIELGALGLGLACSCFALSVLSRAASSLSQQFIWPKLPLLAFGWIGVPVHELSHAMACWAFGHRVRRMKWFDPAGRGGAHGAVEHEFNPSNPYHRAGQLFIGLAPALIGPLVVVALFAFLVSASPEATFHTLVTPTSWVEGARLGLHTVLEPAVWSSPRFWLFAYLAACVCTQIELSSADLGQARSGAIVIAILALVVNTGLAAASFVTNGGYGLAWHARAMTALESGARVWTSLASLSVAVSAATLAVLWLVASAIHLLARKPVPNPFRGLIRR